MFVEQHFQFFSLRATTGFHSLFSGFCSFSTSSLNKKKKKKKKKNQKNALLRLINNGLSG